MMVYCLLIFIFLGCTAGDDHHPEIQLNSIRVPNQTESVLTAGTAFNLSCQGNDSVGWVTNAVRPLRGQLKVLTVLESKPQDTGTYLCGSPIQAWVHLYIKDTTDPSSVFVTPHRHSNAKEGKDFLLKCLLTDPSVTNVTLQSSGHTGGQGGGLPKGMNVTFDPRKGFLIQKMQKSYSGSYVCSGWQNGRETKSRDIDLLVIPTLNHPPSVSVSGEQFIHLKGEKFEVTCLTSNPNHFYDVTWRNQNKEVQNTTITLHYNKQLYMNKTLSIANVTQSHSGQYNCTARNEVGVAVATAHLKVLDGPYLRIHLQLSPNANFKTLVVHDAQSANISNSTMEIDMASTNNISGRMEVFEGQDVMLNVIIEAYPSIISYHWMMPTHSNYSSAVRKQHYINNTYRAETGLQVLRVRPEDQGKYSLHISNSFFYRVINIDLRIFRSPATTVTQENNTLTCSSSGYPPPIILWFTCSGIQDTCSNSSSYKVPPSDAMLLDEEEVRKPLPLSALPADSATAECVAYNDVGLSRNVFILPNRKKKLTLLNPTLIGALSTATILLLLLLIVSYKLQQKPKYEIRWKIIETIDDGNNYTFLDPNQLPYNHKWEFPRDKLRLGAVLGSGAFGKVVEATAYGLGTNDVTRVAVKMLKPRAHSEERDALMSELKILSHLGYHNNIVNLLGACTRGGPMLMITEYCSHGDLLNFLRAHAQDYKASILHVDEVKDGVHYRNMSQNIWSHSDKGFLCCSDYLEMQPILSPGHEHSGEKDSLSMRDLLKFSYQVAQGMDFLATQNCIHRDVAARNVLLTDRHVAKICDFGLARDIRNDDSYIVQGNARLPVKWMAPESIFQCIYTVQSDVWSYGVLLWEIFSLGKSPYPNIAVDTNFYKMIKDGGHMEQPDFAPAKMYQLMMLCWRLQPIDRPTFSTIGQFISCLLPSVGGGKGKQGIYRNIESCHEEEEDLLEMVKKKNEQLP